MPVLMHLSDLHRSLDEPVSNAELVAALERDLGRQSKENPPIAPPDALVVSGDLIRGAPLGDTDPGGTINTQYRQVEEFLGELVDVLFAGDRSNVVICPGNHDVDWSRARAAMERVPEDEIPNDVYGKLRAPGSPLRWNWHELALYRIIDPASYDGRMDQYWGFVNRFYANVNVLRLPTDNDTPLLVELFDRKVLVAAFNSCWLNDCFRKKGGINPEAVARMHLDLRQGWEYDLRIAVWHHNTTGPPSTEDYLNVEHIHTLIDYGFQLGLHGHQHRSEVVMHKLGIPKSGSMAVMSAGSLAAGQTDLPRGINRQYNVIEFCEDLTGARLHIREIELGAFGPRRLNAFGGRSYEDITWERAPSLLGTHIDSQRLNRNLTVNKAEAAYMSGEDREVLSLLRPVIANLDEYGRGLFEKAARRAEQWQTLVDSLSPPRTAGELTSVVEAAVRLRQFPFARRMLLGESRALLSSPQQADLFEWVSLQERIE